MCFYFYFTENAVEFQKPKDTPICSDRFLDVLVSFFKFYYEFEYAENIISVFHGNEINHNIRNISDHKLDPSLLRYLHRITIIPIQAHHSFLSHIFHLDSSTSFKLKHINGHRMDYAFRTYSCTSEM